MDKLCDHNYLKYYKFKQNDIVVDLGAYVGEFIKSNGLKPKCFSFGIQAVIIIYIL